MSVFTNKRIPGARVTRTTFMNSSNDSGARKFITSDSVENNPPGESTSNSEHIVNLAAGLKNVAVAVQSIAAVARVRAAEVRRGLAAPLSRDSSGPHREFGENDVAELQEGIIRDVVRDIGQNRSQTARAVFEDRTGDLVRSARHQMMPVKEEGHTTPTVNTCVPELESILVDIDENKGAVDIFYAQLTFNLAEKDLSKVRAIRIFRSEVSDAVFTRPLPPLSSHGLERINAARARKNQNFTAAVQQRLDESNVQTAGRLLNAVDPYTGQRSSANAEGTAMVPPPLAGRNAPLTNGDIPEALSHLDPSVLNNINVLSNLQSHPVTSAPNVVVGTNIRGGLELGQAQNEQWKSRRSKTSAVVQPNNSLEFEEIAFLTPDKLKGRSIGGRVEYTYTDESIMYGRAYRYFVVTVDSNMNQSARSTIATALVEGLRVPERPSAVVPVVDQRFVMLSLMVEDQLVEKFEVHRAEDDPNRLSEIMASTVSDPAGLTVTHRQRKLEKNGFLLIGEIINPMRGGASFTDRMVRPGGSYRYRIYSVDIFGNKSESPLEVSAFIPDLEQKFFNLKKPTIAAEVDAATHKVKLTFGCNDPLVESLRIERRNLTTGQVGFSTPDQSSRIIMGARPAHRRLSAQGERIQNTEPDSAWPGVFANSLQEQTFIDRSVQFDQTYQYRIYGQDRYGNRTSYDVTPPVMVVRRALINSPLALSARAVVDDEAVRGVYLSWSEANLDRSAEELIGSQQQLLDTGVRTLYQIERKKEGEEIWRKFSLVTGTSFFDPVASGSAPDYRPEFLEVDRLYSYRVQAAQTGAFLSNFTRPVDVFVGFSVGAPTDFVLRTPAVNVRPFYVMLNWETPANSGIVDRWEIERAELNNFAAARLNVKNPAEFKNLQFEKFRTVYREASRFAAKTHDVPGDLNRQLIPGTHRYMDTMVDFGNSYIYRIRAVSPGGQKSSWTYRGIKITSAVFEAKWSSELTPEERQELASSSAPARMQNRVRAMPRSSMSVQPNYSKAPSLRPEPKTKTRRNE